MRTESRMIYKDGNKPIEFNSKLISITEALDDRHRLTIISIGDACSFEILGDDLSAASEMFAGLAHELYFRHYRKCQEWRKRTRVNQENQKETGQ